MPRKTYRKRKPRRKFKKKNYKPSLTISRWAPMADRHRCRLRYNDTINLSIAYFANHTFNANSIFDPDRTGVGHQPLGHDQLAAFYNRYVVLNATCVVKLSSASALCTGALTAVNSNTVPALWDEMVENNRCKTITVPAVGVQSGTRQLKVSCNLKKLYGRLGLTDDRVQSDFGANPAETAMFVVGIQHVDGGSTTVSAYAEVTIYYDVLCFDRNVLPGS